MSTRAPKAARPATAGLALGATGVVFGDIGTSPLYAFRESIMHAGGDPSEVAIGTASLAIWTITIIVSLKYLTFVMKANNNGEGGILALLALLRRWLDSDGKARFGSTRLRTFVLLALMIGAALLFGDGALTPAISVLSAVEGLGAVTPTLAPYVVPIAVAILVILFAVQSRGTESIGRVFGPVMIVWFIVIAVLGVLQILRSPEVLQALLPTHAISYLVTEGWAAVGLLAVIILTVTGAEALYADMGHFGLVPIRVAWYALVMPSLMLCYLGQAALVLRDPAAAPNSFYGMAPNAALTLGLVLLATMATVIASQALITGAFSLASQAIQLRLLPRMRIRHTSDHHEGQIYIPAINWALAVTCIIITVAFGNSSSLASAYVFAVSGTMLATTVGLFAVARTRWHWSPVRLAVIIGSFFVVDAAFFLSTATKIVDGGYVPVVLGGAVLAIMIVWRIGQHILHETIRADEPAWDQVLSTLQSPAPVRPATTGVFMNSEPDRVPQALLTELHVTRSAPRTILSVTVVTRSVPYLESGADPLDVVALDAGVWRILINNGYMQTIDLPQVLTDHHDGRFPWPDDPLDVIYYVSNNNFQDTPEDGGQMSRAPEAVYDFLQRNAASPTDYFSLPPKRVVTIGTNMDL